MKPTPLDSLERLPEAPRGPVGSSLVAACRLCRECGLGLIFESTFSGHCVLTVRSFFFLAVFTGVSQPWV